MSLKPPQNRTRMLRLRTAATALVMTGILGLSTPVAAQPIGTMNTLPSGGTLPTNIKVIDLRSEDACIRGSLPAARCLPAQSLFDRTGAPVSFHALRWLLGTVGLSGNETLLVYAGGSDTVSDDELDDAWAVAGLLRVAGQKRVIVYNGLTPAELAPGEPRSLSRESVYTAPMRDSLLKVGSSEASLRAQLIPFARSGGTTRITIVPHT